MTKTLTKHGNSLALVIDKPILDLLRISPDTELRISTDGNSLIISPVADAKEEADFRAAMKKVHEQYGRTLKALAE